MSGSAEFREKGISAIKEAIDLDNAGDLHSALQKYKTGCNYLLSSIKWEKNKKTKETLTAKVTEYLNRAEAIQKELEEPSKPKKKEVKTGGGDEKDGEDAEAAKLKGALASAIVTETPNVKWDDVAGLETAKGLLKEAVLLPIKFPQLFVGKRKPWKGILLYGPPGTGKSFLAKAVATEAGASTFFSVSSSDLVSKFQGESERLVRNLFEMARAKAPAIIFIDEIDSLCGNRTDGENDSARRIKTEFLVQMQGVGKSTEGILVLGATNTPWDLDPAIRRRFQKRIYIPLPEPVARKVMFLLNIGNTPHELTDDDFTELAEHTEGFSGSDISIVVSDALMQPIRQMSTCDYFRKVVDPETKKRVYLPCSATDKGAEKMSLLDILPEELSTPKVTMSHFRTVLETAKSSVSQADIERHVSWTEEFGQEG
jgi:vacuolar protein-sorting-associated protein 4